VTHRQRCHLFLDPQLRAQIGDGAVQLQDVLGAQLGGLQVFALHEARL
jgi:hypothetical protein